MIVRDAAAAAASESAYAATRGDGASGERAFLGEFSELALEDLSAGVRREFGHDVYARGNLVPRERSTTVSDDGLLVSFVDRGVRAERHRRLDDFAHDGMRHAERRRLRHRGVRVQRGFHLGTIHVLPTDENHILLPIDENDVPVGSNRREVARVEPTVLVEALFVRVGAAPVPAENRRTANPNFANLGRCSVAGRRRENLATRRRVRHANVDERERSTGRAHAIELFVVTGDASRLVGERRHGDFSAALGHAVAEKKLAAEERHRASRGGGRQRASPARQHAKRREIREARRGAVRHHRHHRRREVRDGDAFAFDRGERDVRGERRRRHVSPPGPRHRVRRERVHQMKHGGRVEPHVVRTETHLRSHGDGVCTHDGVRQGHALGRARRAAGVVHVRVPSREIERERRSVEGVEGLGVDAAHSVGVPLEIEHGR